MTPDRNAPSTRSRQATAREFLAVVFRRKWLIVGLFVVTTVTVFAVVLTTPTTFRSIGKIAIRRGEQESVLWASRRMSAWEEELSTEVQVVRSHPVHDRAQALIDDRATRGGPRIKLSVGALDAEVVGASNAVLIAYADRDPKIAEAACDAFITAYVAYRQESNNLSYPKQFFDSELARVTRDLERLQTQRRMFAQNTGTVALEDQQRASVGYLTTLQQRRSEDQSNLEEARTTVKQVKAVAENPGTEVPSSSGGDQVLVDLRLKVLNQEARVAQLKERLRDDSPDVVNATATLETLRGLLRREVDARVQVAQSRVEALESRLVPTDAEIARIQSEMATMPSKQMSLSEMDREIEVLKDRYKDLAKNSDQARITENTTSGITVLVLEPAGPATPMNARDYVRLALAPAFSLVVGIGLAFFVDGLDTRVRTAGDAETLLELPVLASITDKRRRGHWIAPSEETASR